MNLKAKIKHFIRTYIVCCHEDTRQFIIHKNNHHTYPDVAITTECDRCNQVLKSTRLEETPIAYINKLNDRGLLSVKEYFWATRNDRIERMKKKYGMP